VARGVPLQCTSRTTGRPTTGRPTTGRVTTTGCALGPVRCRPPVVRQDRHLPSRGRRVALVALLRPLARRRAFAICCGLTHVWHGCETEPPCCKNFFATCQKKFDILFLIFIL